MAEASLVVSIAAAIGAVGAFLATRRQAVFTRHANSIPMLVELFADHRGRRLARARQIVNNELRGQDLSGGLASITDKCKQDLVLELAWYYDNLGALVAHDIVDIDPVSGYLGGSVVTCWEVLKPLVMAEREARSGYEDPGRWQIYFENLARLVAERPPDHARRKAPRWEIGAAPTDTGSTNVRWLVEVWRTS